MNPKPPVAGDLDATTRGSPHGNTGISIYCLLQMARVYLEKFENCQCDGIIPEIRGFSRRGERRPQKA